MPTAADIPSGTMPKQTPRPRARCWCDHSTNPANFAGVGGGGAMYAVTAGYKNKVNSVWTSDTVTSRSVVRLLRSSGSRSFQASIIEYPIPVDHHAERDEPVAELEHAHS